jgi:L-amino acid N-acyltransferase YncA
MLESPADLSFYPRYVEAYNQLFSTRPELRGEVHVESQETLAECHAERFLYEIVVDGARAGVVAARRQVVAGLRGTFMVEILLDGPARGERLGPAVHQRLAAKVAANELSAILTGTIAPANEPSLKTATRAGRIEIGAWHWIDI